ncbi:MAG: hypothetical protein CR996_01520 [Draconibacterium sp.]|nr:MAG: hypothetical protein CR996_01520 [Draconibacterium sp.]
MKKSILLYSFLFGLVLAFSGCQKMEDIHSKYLADGDIIYAPRPLLTQALGGKNRVVVKYYLVNAVNVKKCIVEWDDGAGSQTVDISPKVPLDSIEVVIPNLEERSYIFKVYTIDSYGNRSIKDQVTGSAYATKFESSLTNRPLLNIEGGGTTDSLIVTWGTPGDNYTGTEIMYYNGAGDQVTLSVPAGDDVTIIKDWLSESEMKYYSSYIPEANAVDTFKSGENSAMLPMFIKFDGVAIDKTNWEIVDFSTEEPAEGAPNGLASAAIDGDVGTFWHSQWSGGQPGYPHYFTFDMKDVVKINKIEAFRRSGDSRGPTKFEIHTSLDGVNFTLQGSFNYDPNAESQSYDLPSLPLAKYVKYVATEGPNHFAFLAELNVYGQVASNINKSEWEITGFSSEEPAESNWGPPIQGLAAAAIDDDLGTFWHSQWSGAQPGYPHYFIVDMKNTVRIMALECFRRQNNGNGQTKFKIYTSNDGENFVDQGEFDFNSQINDGQMYSLSFLPEARYFKYEATEGPDHYAFLAEIYVYGSIVE